MLTMRYFQLFLIEVALLCVAGRSSAVTLNPARRDVWGCPRFLQHSPSNSKLAFIRGGSDDQVQQEESIDEDEEEEEEEESWEEEEVPALNVGDDEEEDGD